MPLIGPAPSNLPCLPNGTRIDLVERFESIATRRRSSALHSRIAVELDRIDAGWFAAQVAGGMFAASSRTHLPGSVRLFCRGCAGAMRGRRGRPKLRGDHLAAAVRRQKAAIIQTDVDPRHLKRLKRQQRSEAAFYEGSEAMRGLLGGDLFERS
ncbi:MAG: hypothetical protein ABIS14_12165 [Sphingomonas sp.]